MNLAAENERVKALLTKLQNVRYRKSSSVVKSDQIAAPSRISEADRGAMNREMEKIRAENARLRQINQDLSVSRPAQREVVTKPTRNQNRV